MKLSNKKKNRSRMGKRASKGKRVSYDNLEARLALTTFFVNSTVDDASGMEDGLISLREAMIAANTNEAFGDAPAGDADGDAIRFNLGAVEATLTLTEGEIEITDDVLIQGGNSAVIVDAEGNSRHFNITTSERVAIGKVSFVGGSADQGGSISTTGGGPTVVFASSFSNNEATGLGGGAIYNETGTLYVGGESTFDMNHANGESGSGGAILSASGTTAVLEGSMTNNTANRAGGAVEIIDGNFYATNVAFGGAGERNIAGPGDSAAPGNGGGLHVTGEATVGINGGSFIGNFAAREGGGLWNQANSNMYIVNGAEISGNTGAGDESNRGGGGIFNNGGNVFVKESTIRANAATGASGSGGGILSIDGRVLVIDSLVTLNSAARAGGGAEIIDGFFGFFGSTVSDNDAGINVEAAPGNGGALHVSGVSTIVVSNTDVTGNEAASEGGGLWNQANSDMFVNGGSLIEGNTATGDGADEGGGGLFNNGGNLYVKDSLVNGNFASGASGSGGGVFSTDGLLRVIDSTISNNAAARAGGGVEIIDGTARFEGSNLSMNDVGVTFTAAPGNGGALHVTGMETIVIFDSTAITGNSANQGGGVWNQTGSLMFFENGTRVEDNTATLELTSVGGGVYNKGYMRAVDSIFANNESSFRGGGIFFTPTATGQLSNNGINGNDSGNEGGGLFNLGSVFVQGNNFSDNVVSINGGGVFTADDATTTLDNNTFSGNLPNDTN